MKTISPRRTGYKVAVLLCLLLVSRAHAAEHGAVTAIAALNAQTSVFVGYASGAVYYCTRLSGCTQMDGTPASAVTALDVLHEGGIVRAWVGYENGTLYFCTLTGGCSLQELSATPARSKHPQ